MICSFNFLIFLAVCLNIFTAINIKILANSNQQTQRYNFTSQIAAFLSVVLITEMLEICIQTSYDQNIQLILKSYLPVVLGTTLIHNQTYDLTYQIWREFPTSSPYILVEYLKMRFVHSKLICRWCRFQFIYITSLDFFPFNNESTVLYYRNYIFNFRNLYHH